MGSSSLCFPSCKAGAAATLPHSQGSSVVIAGWECRPGRNREQVPGRKPPRTCWKVPAAINCCDNVMKDCHSAHACEARFCRLDNLPACCIWVCYPSVVLRRAARTAPVLYECRRITESQNHRIVGVGRDLCGSSSPTLLPKQGHLQQAAQDLVQAGLEYLQRRRRQTTERPGSLRAAVQTAA